MARVYDGSGDGSKIFETTSIIGKPIATAVKEKPAQIDALKNMRRWPVTISYFEADKKDERAGLCSLVRPLMRTAFRAR